MIKLRKKKTTKKTTKKTVSKPKEVACINQFGHSWAAVSNAGGTLSERCRDCDAVRTRKV